ncbi:hypothetical protein V7149_04870 [Bacillus sp. JJ1503]|uniref:hypothetical protein n=1 Tax=Bacillus sp. JJ1503 TaxID=3122956 RepID=UPI00300096D4
MVPRSSRHRSNKRKQRKRMFKAFSSSVAVSSLILGSGHLVSPTYSEFNSVKEQEVDISACFIFPQTIEQMRDRTVVLQEEAKAILDEALGKVAELDVESMNKKLDSLKKDAETEAGDETGEADVAAPSQESGLDMNTIDGLQGAQVQLKADIAALENIMNTLQNTITANEEEIKALDEITKEIDEMVTQLEEIITEVFPKARDQIQEKLDEINEIIEYILEIKDVAIQDCKFEPQFFEDILLQMNTEKAKTEEFISNLEEKLATTGEQIIQLNNNAVELQTAMEELRQANVELLASIESIKAQIAALNDQIAVIDQHIADMKALQEQKDSLFAGMGALKEYLEKSTDLSEEQIQLLLEKLAGVVKDIEKITLDTKDMSAIEKAILELDQEIKQEEEKAKLEKERLAKEEEEREKAQLEKEANEAAEAELDQEQETGEGEDEVIEEEEPEDEEAEEDGEDKEETADKDKEGLEEGNEGEDGNENEEESEKGDQELEKGKDQENKDNPGQDKPEKENPAKPEQGNDNQGQKPQEPKPDNNSEKVDQGNKEQARKENAKQRENGINLLLGLLERQKSGNDESTPQLKDNNKVEMRNEETEHPAVVEVAPTATHSPV